MANRLSTVQHYPGYPLNPLGRARHGGPQRGPGPGPARTSPSMPGRGARLGAYRGEALGLVGMAALAPNWPRYVGQS